MSAIKPPKLVLSQVLDLPAAVAGFYVQEAVMAKVNGMQNTTMKIRLEDDIREFNATYRKYADRLAGAFFDYIALASFGEARHAPVQAKLYIPQIFYKWNRGSNQETIKVRNQTYRHALKFDPYRFLPTLATLFYDGQWRDAYGGKRWGNIADAGMMYKKVSSTVFIDHAVDLSHNGGSMFSKNVLFQPYDASNYLYMLSMKRKFSILEDDCEFLENLWVAQNAKPFLKLAAKLGLIPASMIYHSCQYVSIEFPETIKWGMLPIMESDILPSYKNLSSSEKLDEDDENDDEDEDEKEINMADLMARAPMLKPYLDEIQAKCKPMEQVSMF